MNNLPLRVGILCTGNICRSPMAEVVLRHLIADDPVLRGRVEVTSAGTANWHVGSPMDPRARRALDRAGRHEAGTPAAFGDRTYLDHLHVIVVMTSEHLTDIAPRLTNPNATVILLRNLLSPGEDLDLVDPYYGDDAAFDDCLELISQAAQRLLEELRPRLDAGWCEV